MEFFNKKEEVLEIILTQKGRQLFSTGKFKPVYYSFHDTDIIYDNNSNEEQNAVVPRIKETPTLKQFGNLYNNTDNSKLNSAQNQPLYCELGNKTLTDQYKPAWQINFMSSPPFQHVGGRYNIVDGKNYEIKLSSSFDKNNANQDLIPQIDIQNLVQYLYITGSQENEKFFLVIDDPLIFNISEYNSFEVYEKEEFEIEMFYIDEKSTSKNIVSNNISFGPQIEENVFKYFNILFDKQAEFQFKINSKNIYDDMVNKDGTNC